MVETKNTQPTANVVVDATPNTVPIVPDDWAALGVTSGYAPRSAEDLRFWILGPSGEGKSVFISSIPDHLILDFEDGASAIPGGRATRVHIKNYEQYENIIDKLIADAKAGNRQWKRISFDTVDEWAGLITAHLQKEKSVEDITEFGSQGHGYNLILNRCWSKIRDLEHAGYIWSCVGHLKLKEEFDPVSKKSRTVPRPAVYPSFARQIQGKSDFQLTIYCIPQTVDITKEKKLGDGRIIKVPAGTEVRETYYLDSRTSEIREGKSRGVPGMDRKFELPLVNGWDEFAKRYNVAVEQAKTQYQNI